MKNLHQYITPKDFDKVDLEEKFKKTRKVRKRAASAETTTRICA